MFHISFTLEYDNNILWEIYSTCTLSVRKRVIHTRTVYICFTQVYVYGIAYFPFHSIFLSVPFSVPRFSNTLFIVGENRRPIFRSHVYHGKVLAKWEFLSCSLIAMGVTTNFVSNLFLLWFKIRGWFLVQLYAI